MNIYVGNLPFDVTGEDLEAAFVLYGKVNTARVAIDRETGRARGFGFVEMPVAAEANAAIKALNGKDLKGRTMTVNEARPREERGGGNDRGGFRSDRGPRSFGGRR